MKTKKLVCTTLLGFTLAPVIASAQLPLVYPGKGQSAEKQASDTTKCQTWAKEQTGFDPSIPQSTTQAPTQSNQGRVARGAGRGAAVGAIGGAIGGDAGKGAAIGAGVGAASGVAQRRQIARENEAAQSQANSQRDSQIAGYNKAFGTCMSGKGYSVSQ